MTDTRGRSSRTWTSWLGRRFERAQAAEHGPAGGDDDLCGARLQLGNRLLADVSVTRTLSVPSCVICAFPGSSRVKSGVCLPFCSNTTRIGFIAGASGAVMVTWSGVAMPTNFSGFSMAMAGGAMRPATTQAPPAARSRISTRPRRNFIC